MTSSPRYDPAALDAAVDKVDECMQIARSGAPSPRAWAVAILDEYFTARVDTGAGSGNEQDNAAPLEVLRKLVALNDDEGGQSSFLPQWADEWEATLVEARAVLGRYTPGESG